MEPPSLVQVSPASRHICEALAQEGPGERLVTSTPKHTESKPYCRLLPGSCPGSMEQKEQQDGEVPGHLETSSIPAHKALTRLPPFLLSASLHSPIGPNASSSHKCDPGRSSRLGVRAGQG